MDAVEFASKLELALLGHTENEVRWNKIQKALDYQQNGYKLNGICLPSSLIDDVYREQQRVCVIGYPYGDNSFGSKWQDILNVFESSMNNKTHIDYVPNFSSVSIKCFYKTDIRYLKAVCKNEVRLIVESGRFNQDILNNMISAAEDGGADMIKTSTGTFKDDPSPTERIRRVRHTKLRVKASGGIKDLKTALECLDAGADIIGSSSALEIFEEFLNKQ